ncbi:MAG: DUF5667 domain-containing protein [bacterium]|nr:DUF5667 domain-containing protein [bacterium]
MINFFPKFVRKLRMVTVNKRDRLRIRNILMEHMQTLPVRGGGMVRRYLHERSALQQIQRSLFFPLKPMTILAGLAIVALIGGGAAVAAEQTVPGDVLFPIKVTVNEGVMTILAFSPEAKAELEVVKTERRLEELEKLAASGRLDADVAAKVKARLESHADKASEFGLKLQANGNFVVAAQVFSDLEAAMNAHEKILIEIGEMKVNGEVVAESIVATLQLRGQSATNARLGAEADIRGSVGADVKAAAEGKMTAAANKVAEVQAFIERMSARAGATATAEAETRLDAAEILIAEGSAKLEAEAFADAFMKFQEAMRVAQEAQLLVRTSTQTQLDLNVELNGSTETEVDTEKETKEEGNGTLELDLGL